MNCEKEIKEISEKIDSLSGKLTYLDGYLNASKIWGIIFVGLILGWLGYTSWKQIPKIVEKQFDAIASEAIESAVSQAQAHGSLAISSASQAESALSDIQKKKERIEQLITLLESEYARLSKLETEQPNNEDQNKNNGEQKSSTLSDEGLDSNVNSVITVVEQTPPDSQEPQTEREVLLFEGLWAKSGYFLLLDSKMKLNVDSVSDDTAAIRITDQRDNNLASDSLRVGGSLELSLPDGDRLKIEVTRIGGAGYNPFKKAAFFKVTKWISSTKRG